MSRTRSSVRALGPGAGYLVTVWTPGGGPRCSAEVRTLREAKEATGAMRAQLRGVQRGAPAPTELVRNEGALAPRPVARWRRWLARPFRAVALGAARVVVALLGRFDVADPDGTTVRLRRAHG